MCGIAGLVRPGDPDSLIADIERMVQATAHRGPDGTGSVVRGAIALGHSRLAIQDLSPAASQPMISKCGRYLMAFNGEIYNKDDLSVRLNALGVVPRSHGDSEALFLGLQLWGKSLLPSLNGMFALAFIDLHQRQLLLARDRYGIKPLYIARRPGGTSLAFSSETKAFRGQNELVRDLDLEGLAEYLTFQNLFSPRTLTSGVSLLPAGTYLEVNTETLREVHARYWDFKFVASRAMTPSTAQEELANLLRQGTERHLLSDVPVGAYLSGGIDSASIAAIASQLQGHLTTFTCGFDLVSASGIELAFDERKLAEMMSAHIGSEHYEVVLKAGDMERSLHDVVESLEEPRVGQSYPNFFAAKLASRFVKVALAGTAGDELFGGYPWRYMEDPCGGNLRAFAKSYFSIWQRLLSATEFENVTSKFRDALAGFDALNLLADVLDGHDSPLETRDDAINYSLYLEAKTFLQGLLVVEDKLSMAHGLEVRLPFLDNDIVEFAMACPATMKVLPGPLSHNLDENLAGVKTENSAARTRHGKILLRTTTSSLLPPEIVSAPKQGFSAPDASWFKGPSMKFVADRLLNRNSPIYEILEFHACSDIVTEHLEGRRNRRLALWSFLYLDEWMQQNVI